MTDSLFDLTGKVAVVTGGSRGLGQEICLAFAERGADLVVASRKAGACEELAAEIRRKYSRRAVAVGCNVSDWAQCDALVAAAYEAFGRVDVLVNNAGAAPVYPSLLELDEGLYDKVFATNLKGPFRLTAAFGSRMQADGGGSIINISSVTALRPTPDALPYAAAKAGLNVFTEGFAKALGPEVRVNAIVAGPFLTDISKAWDPEQFEQLFASMALRRGGRPDEIVGAALYFASTASTYCTAAMLRVDGGFP
ncbi:MAG TPA: SDR family oxidoreductase [Sporichthyaceae bacterium]|jgi:NAD(P)-dependent dehydrogenase (short-subunit alcohol dehydrogenase family)|nr:SDR family oxidoreductase [Sporichthyaceae bacterium]